MHRIILRNFGGRIMNMQFNSSCSVIISRKRSAFEINEILLVFKNVGERSWG